MARSEKLYERLAECEREYLLLMREEFSLQSEGLRAEKSIIFSLSPHDLGRKDRVNWLHKEIVSLRRKLNEPIRESVVDVVERFVNRFNELGVNQRHNEWVRMSKETLAELNELPASMTS